MADNLALSAGLNVLSRGEVGRSGGERPQSQSRGRFLLRGVLFFSRGCYLSRRHSLQSLACGRPVADSVVLETPTTD